jgi:hypothetical protein
MATIFKKQDVETCCRCDLKEPSFRLISLELAPNHVRDLAPECAAMLVCQDCLKLELDDFHESLDQVMKPLEKWELPEERCLSRAYGVVVVPLKLTYGESRLLVEELESDGLERFQNWGSATK